MIEDSIPESWRSVLEPALNTPQARQLGSWLREQETEGKVIYPPRGERLRAFELTPLDQVKIVILGQDPYHGPGQAHGLAFSTAVNVRIPPSLANIYRELEADLGIAPASHGNLEHWARQGVLLLNNALTVEANKAGSHAKAGWAAITDAAITAVAQRKSPTVFILWGSHAQAKAARIAALQSPTPHLVLRSVHPSPLSSYLGFFGSQPFSKANDFLTANGRGPINW
ncbi:MAG: uracil-DNA glycosylase [Pontixanthobacter sp.]